MKKKDLIFYAGTAVLLAFSTQQAKADEQGASDQTPENTSAVVAKTTTSSETQNTTANVVGTDQAVQIENTVATVATPVTPTPSSDEVTSEKVPSEQPTTAVVASRAPYGARARVVETENNSLPTEHVQKPSGTLSIENSDQTTGTFDAVVSNITSPGGVKEVLVPSWSLENGQDDLIWHKATKQTDGSYRVTIKASEHKWNKGNYRADAYIVDNSGNPHYIAERVVSVDYVRPSGVLTIENNNPVAGTFDAVVSNIVAPTGLKEVLVPSWSLENGQDDLVWHKATRQADGSYRVTIKANDHKNSTGNYRADAYIVDDSNNRFYLTEKVVEVHQVKPSGTVTIENKNSETGTFDAVIRNVVAPYGLKEVLVPTWSNKNGQDDLVWHKAERQDDGSYRATIKASDHKNDTGEFNVHIYYVDQNNQRNYITETKTEVHEVKPSGTVTIENNNTVTGTFDAVIRNVVAPNGLKEVLIPTWSDSNGPDDLVWHKAVRQSDGSYRATIKASDHKNEDGKYNVHVYYVDQNNQRSYITETTTEVRQARRSGTILIQNNNKDTGTFDVIIKDVYSPKGVQTVQVPTWSDKDGQDDIRWYEATRQANGDYKVSVKASDHKNSTGKYHVHLYYIQNDGSRVGVGTTTTEVEFRNAKTKTQASIKNVNSGAGTYTVTVDQAPQGRRIKNIRVAAWSQAHQENLYWYSTAPSGMHTEVQVSAANHQYQSGNYTTHVYVDYVDGGVEGFNLGQTALHPRATVDQTAFSPRVTNGQRDRVLRAAASLVGVRGGTAAHQQLVNDYNSVKPLPVGYAVKTTDDWCDIFVTTVFQREGLSGLIGRECGVERHIQIFKRLGIWNEDGTTTPKAGDIITFNWDQNSQKTMALRITSELLRASQMGSFIPLKETPTTKSVAIPTESDMAIFVDLQPHAINNKKRSLWLLFLVSHPFFETLGRGLDLYGFKG